MKYSGNPCTFCVTWRSEECYKDIGRSRAGRSVLEQQSAAVWIMVTEMPKIRFVPFQEHQDVGSSVHVAELSSNVRGGTANCTVLIGQAVP